MAFDSTQLTQLFTSPERVFEYVNKPNDTIQTIVGLSFFASASLQVGDAIIVRPAEIAVHPKVDTIQLTVIATSGGSATARMSKSDFAPSYNAGTFTSGTYTPSRNNGKYQHATNNGAHTLAPPTSIGTIYVEYTNGASAGTVTTSGFTHVDGSFTTTNTHKFLCKATKTNSYSHLDIIALQ